jgi:hypothetical protein
MVNFSFTVSLSIKQFARTAHTFVDDCLARGSASYCGYIYRLNTGWIYLIQKKVVEVVQYASSQAQVECCQPAASQFRRWATKTFREGQALTNQLTLLSYLKKPYLQSGIQGHLTRNAFGNISNVAGRRPGNSPSISIATSSFFFAGRAVTTLA